METRFDKRLYAIKHLSSLEGRPAKLRERVFQRLFRIVEIACFTSEEAVDYEESLKHYRDLKNTLDTAKEEGREEGRMEEKSEVALRCAWENMPAELIAKVTGLTVEEIFGILKTSRIAPSIYRRGIRTRFI